MEGLFPILVVIIVAFSILKSVNKRKKAEEEARSSGDSSVRPTAASGQYPNHTPGNAAASRAPYSSVGKTTYSPGKTTYSQGKTSYSQNQTSYSQGKTTYSQGRVSYTRPQKTVRAEDYSRCSDFSFAGLPPCTDELEALIRHNHAHEKELEQHMHFSQQ